MVAHTKNVDALHNGFSEPRQLFELEGVFSRAARMRSVTHEAVRLDVFEWPAFVAGHAPFREPGAKLRDRCQVSDLDFETSD